MLHRIKMIFIVVGMLAGAVAQAQIDDASRTLLIEKLDRVYLNLAPKDPSKVAVTLRLADLYAEKARIDANKELNSGCTNCVAGEADRKKALKLYLEVLDRTPEANQGKVMVQIGHLYQLTGAEANAMNFYQKILQSQAIAPQVKAEAQLSIAEIYFKRRDFQNAKGYYNQVLSNASAESKGLAAYRIAWCSFNMGNVDTAIGEIEMVLKTPALLNRGGAGQTQTDVQFHEEVSRDYATFLSKVKMNAGHIENLYKLSPESTRIQNVQSLASDAERLGKKEEALQAWTYIYQYLSQPEDRLSAQIAMAQLQFDLGNKAKALESFSNGLQLSRDLRSCGSAQCDELRRRSRQFVVNWNQLEKNNPSADLLTAYGQYLASYPEDIDIAIYAAQAARAQKNFVRASELNQQAGTLLAKDPENGKKLETVLLTQLEIAEEAKDKAMIAGSLSLYLAQSQLKTKEFEVRYQQARGLYEDGQYALASEALRSLALTQTGEAAIRKQAAELSLDALVLMKDEAKIGLWATEYAAMGFAKGTESNDFAQIAQKSILTKSAELAKAGNNQGAYDVLTKFQPANAAFEDQVKYYKNKIILSETLKKYPEALAAADDLLHLPKVGKEDTEFAWSRKAAIAELTLDFATALAATEKMTAMPTDEKALKLAVFAELSGRSSESFYTQYLKVAKDEENKQLVAAELVRKSKTPEKDIESLKPYLAKAPQLVAQLYSEAFARNSSAAILQKVAKDEKLKNTSSGKLMSRVLFLQQFGDFKTKMTALKLETQNQQKLASSIRSRAAMLDKLEAMTKTAIQSGDWTAQLVSIDLLGKESERFYQELISAPMPEGLSQEDEGEYLNLLSAQAAPFQTKAAAAKVKVEQFWQDTQWLPALKSSWAQKSVRNLVAVELKALAEIAPANVQAELSKVGGESDVAVATKGPKPSLQEIETARRNVYLDPMNSVALKALQGLEDRAENMPMVQYLQTRIEQLGQGVQK